uniref:Uncharacterized protein n=1 Tax=Onchocerca volvulus TaxID=6282 RepID=A0A8R1XNM2_ONCVO
MAQIYIATLIDVIDDTQNKAFSAAQELHVSPARLEAIDSFERDFRQVSGREESSQTI